MKKGWIVTVVVLMLNACASDKETDLDGKWQLLQIEVDGVIQQVDTVFYNFQNTLFSYQIYNPTTDTYKQAFGFKTIQGDNDIQLDLQANKGFLQLTDWSDTTRIFTIEKSSGKQLILKGDRKRYIFHNF